MALVALYNSTDGSNWNDATNWLNGPVFTWVGVNVEDGRVRDIQLCGNNLNGTLPEEFFNLTALRSVELCDNNINGQILPSIGLMTELEHINFNGLQLTGELPAEIGTCTSLAGLHINNSDLSGALPVALCTLPLTDINIEWNNFSNESCPAVNV